MSDKPKRKVSEKSLKNLKPFSERSESERRELAKKGAEKTNQIKAQKVKRENALSWLWDEYGIKLTDDILKNGTTKDKTELLKAILPKDKQVNEISGNIGIEKIFITQEEKKATDKHIDDVINDGLEQ